MAKKKKRLLAVTALLTAVFAVGLFFYAAYSAALAGIKIEYDISSTHQTVNGFGASSAWYFQDLANGSEEMQDKAMSDLYSADGMGLSIFRYNIGGGSVEIADKVGYQKLDPFKMTESFFVSQNYISKESFSDPANYNFSKDAGVVTLMEKALSHGTINKLVFFANSPHYLLTKSGLTHGKNESENNLPKENYEAFCDYLLIISHNLYAKLATDTGNLENVQLYISPINEPQWKWGGKEATQEGCHFDPAEAAEFLEVFWKKLKAFNLENGTNYKLDAFESGSYKLKSVKDYLKAAENYEWFKELDEISIHSYHAPTSKGKKTQFVNYLEENYHNMKINMSEFCELVPGRDESIDSGLLAAEVLLKDFKYLNASEWNWWLLVASEDYNSGLVYYDRFSDGTERLSYLKRYYTMSHFSKFVKNGSVRIDIKQNDIIGISGMESVAFLTPDNEVVIILLNDTSNELKITFKNPNSNGKVFVTSATENLAETTLNGNRITIAKKSIATIVIPQ